MRDRLANPFARAGIALAGLLLLLIGSMQLIYGGRVLPGAYVGSLSVAGQTEADLAEQLTEKARSLETLTFDLDGRMFQVPAAEVGLRVDAQATAEAALAAGRQGGLDSLLTPSRLGFTERDVGVRYQLNHEALKRKLADLTQGTGNPARDAAIRRDGAQFSIVPEQPGEAVDLDQAVRDTVHHVRQLENRVTLRIAPDHPEVTARDLFSAKAAATLIASQPLQVEAGDQRFTVSPTRLAGWVTFASRSPDEDNPRMANATLVPAVTRALHVSPQELALGSRSTVRAEIDREAVGLYVPELAEAVDRPAVNARLSFSGGQLNITGQPRDGLVVDRPAAVSELTTAVAEQRPARVAVVAKPADIRQETLPTLGITTLIGSATTTFQGSPANRTYNIGVGASQFNGILIKPGEEFSFNQVLGHVGPETGYREELVIKENRTVPEYGGGLCQVSTTMFRAALDSGLPITARTNHFYAVHYYAPIGMDATIYPPSPDMKFVNNTPGHILVQTSQSGDSLTYQFYGTDDGRSSRTEIIHIAASEENGGTASFRYVVDGGPQPIDRVFSSTYRPQKDFPKPGERSLN